MDTIDAAVRSLRTTTHTHTTMQVYGGSPRADTQLQVTRMFTTRVELGLLDLLGSVPYADIPYSVVGNAAHRQVARQAAAQSVVLLSNTNATLPLAAASISKYVAHGYGASSHAHTHRVQCNQACCHWATCQHHKATTG